jgi:hypothetical protein
VRSGAIAGVVDARGVELGEGALGCSNAGFAAAAGGAGSRDGCAAAGRAAVAALFALAIADRIENGV